VEHGGRGRRVALRTSSIHQPGRLLVEVTTATVAQTEAPASCLRRWGNRAGVPERADLRRRILPAGDRILVGFSGRIASFDALTAKLPGTLESSP
jgi:hypothetical protein